MSPMSVDNEFWSIFDFRFIDGRPFDEAEVSSRESGCCDSFGSAHTFGEEKLPEGKSMLIICPIELWVL